jgi:hypothetical protein
VVSRIGRAGGCRASRIRGCPESGAVSQSYNLGRLGSGRVPNRCARCQAHSYAQDPLFYARIEVLGFISRLEFSLASGYVGRRIESLKQGSQALRE